MTFTLRKVASAFVLLLMTASGLAQDYDLVIKNGRVIDPETMFDSVTNVGILDGRIAAITTDKLSGKRTINAGNIPLDDTGAEQELGSPDTEDTK